MDIRALRYFVETVRQGGFTRAAQSLGVTQSTVSKMLRQLEDELGETLIVRGTRQIVLTESGHVVMERGQEILAASQRLLSEVRETQALRRGRLDLGIPPMINMLFTGVLKTFRKRYPGITLTLHEDTGQEIERRVASGILELGLTIMPANDMPGLLATPVVGHDIYALGTPELLRHARQEIAIQDLQQTPLVLLNDDFALSRLLKQAFAHAGFVPVIAAQSSQWDWLVSMASVGMGVALLPEPFLTRMSQQGLVTARLQPTLHWQVAHVWNGRYLSQAAQAWLEICQQEFGGDWLASMLEGIQD